MKTSPAHHHPPLHPAFSLVEVMLALAIASMGFITLLGLMPHGLQLSRDAATISAEARIKQKLVGELQTASWTDLDWTGYGPLRYFNDQGIELDPDELEDSPDAALTLQYVAAVQMPDTPMDLLLPSGDQAQDQEPEPYLRRVRICMAPTSNIAFDFNSALPRRITTFTAIIASIDG